MTDLIGAILGIILFVVLAVGANVAFKSIYDNWD